MIAVTIRTAKIVAFIQFIPRISLPSVPSARSSFRPPHDLETGPPQFGDDAQRELLDIAVRVLFDGCGDEAHKFEFLPERWHPTFPMCRTLPTRTIATLSRSSTSLLNSEGKGSSFRVEIRTVRVCPLWACVRNRRYFPDPTLAAIRQVAARIRVVP